MTAKEKVLLIKGPLEDLSDLLRIARVEGRKVLRAEKVKVKPLVLQYENGYVVFVEPDGSGCSKASVVGSG
jgi:hypothetical protein